MLSHALVKLYVALIINWVKRYQGFKEQHWVSLQHYSQHCLDRYKEKLQDRCCYWVTT